METTKLVQDLRVVVQDAEELLRATAGMTGEKIEKIRARAEESLRVARAGLERAGREVDARVRENPWTAVGIAAGVGLLIGLLIGRGGRD